MVRKNKTEKRIAAERLRSAFRAGERHARAIDKLAADDAGALASEGGAASNARVDRLHERVERLATRVTRDVRDLRGILGSPGAPDAAAGAQPGGEAGDAQDTPATVNERLGAALRSLHAHRAAIRRYLGAREAHGSDSARWSATIGVGDRAVLEAEHDLRAHIGDADPPEEADAVRPIEGGEDAPANAGAADPGMPGVEASPEAWAAMYRRQRDEARAQLENAVAGRDETRRAREALLRERNAIAEAAAGLLDEVEENDGFYGEQGERLAALLAGDAPEGDGDAGEATPDIGNEALQREWRAGRDSAFRQTANLRGNAASARYWRAEAARLARERDEARAEAQRLSEAYGGVGEHLDSEEEAGLRDALAEAQRERGELRDAVRQYLGARHELLTRDSAPPADTPGGVGAAEQRLRELLDG